MKTEAVTPELKQQRFSADKLKEAYQRSGRRAAEIVTECECSIGAFYQITSGKASPGVELLLRLCFAVGVSIEDVCEDMPAD